MYLAEKRCTIPDTNKINKESMSPSGSNLNPHPNTGNNWDSLAFKATNKNPIKVNHTPIIWMLTDMKRFEKKSPAPMVAGIMTKAK